MTVRDADGTDKIVAFERGLSDAAVALAFETPGIHAVVVNDEILLAYQIGELAIYEFSRHRLYGEGHSGHKDVDEYLASEARTFQLPSVIGYIH
jgi:hypothetical protein